MTDLDVANKALVLLGVAPISSLTVANNAARTVNRLLPTSKLAVLSEFAWSFALRLQELAASSDTVPPGFRYAFTYPASAEALYQVYDARRMRVPFVVQNGFICTNAPAANVEFTYRETNLARWSDAAAEALAARLASDAATALTGSAQLSFSLLEKYNLLVAAAKRNSLNEEYLPQRPATHYIDVR